jgi:hypothetical protein
MVADYGSEIDGIYYLTHEPFVGADGVAAEIGKECGDFFAAVNGRRRAVVV